MQMNAVSITDFLTRQVYTVVYHSGRVSHKSVFHYPKCKLRFCWNKSQKMLAYSALVYPLSCLLQFLERILKDNLELVKLIYVVYNLHICHTYAY